MEVGAMMFVTDRSLRPDDLAREVEARGLASLLVPEHTHIPVDHSPYPGGAELPDHYRRTLDPLVALTAAAGATSDILVGTGVCLVAQHDPIVLAKQVATLDILSGGRFVLGVGYGWDVPETEAHGVAFGDRRAVVRERVLAMQRLWTEDVAQFHGDHVQLAASWSWPKPVQSPHPPVYLGAAMGPQTIAEVAEWADGWMPIGGKGLGEAVPPLRKALQANGRDPASLRVWVTGGRPDVDKLRHFAAMGASHASFWIPPAGRDEVVAALDELARVREALSRHP